MYVDYTGGGCPQSVIDQYHQLLLTTVFGNPHSNNPTSSHYRVGGTDVVAS